MDSCQDIMTISKNKARCLQGEQQPWLLGFLMSFLPPLQLLFLVLSLLQFWDHVYAIGQQGLTGYWRTPFNCLEVSLPHMHKHTHRQNYD